MMNLQQELDALIESTMAVCKRRQNAANGYSAFAGCFEGSRASACRHI